MENPEKQNIYSPLEKKIRKVVEEVILCYQEELREGFTDAELLDVLKHKAQIGKLAVEDKQLENIIKNEVIDCIDCYLTIKLLKRQKSNEEELI